MLSKELVQSAYENMGYHPSSRVVAPLNNGCCAMGAVYHFVTGDNPEEMTSQKEYSNKIYMFMRENFGVGSSFGIGFDIALAGRKLEDSKFYSKYEETCQGYEIGKSTIEWYNNKTEAKEMVVA